MTLFNKVLQLRHPGGIENFLIKNLPLRPPAPKEALVKVSACAVAYRDVLDRKGAFKFIKQPVVLGHEFSGEVVAVGDEVEAKVEQGNSRWKVGDRVVSLHWDQDAAWPTPLKKGGAVDSMYGLTLDGGYAQYVYCPHGGLARAPDPDHMTLQEASCLVSTFGTVWWGAVSRGGLRKGHRVLVTGASGGVGSAAVQLCVALGCHVSAITTSAAKVAYLRDTLHCHNVILMDATSTPGKPSFSTKLPEVDFVIESVGGPTFATSLRAVVPGGCVILLGNVENSTVDLPLGYCILNSIQIIGSDSIRRDALDSELIPFMKKAQMKPNVHSIVPLERAGEIHSLLESRSVSGRILLDPWTT